MVRIKKAKKIKAIDSTILKEDKNHKKIMEYSNRLQGFLMLVGMSGYEVRI